MAEYLQELRQSIDDRKKRTAILKPSAQAAQTRQYGVTDGGGQTRTAANTAMKPTTARTGQQSLELLKPSAQAAREKQYGMTDSGGGIAGAAVKQAAARTAPTTVIKPSAKAAQEQQYGIVDWKNTKPQTAVKPEAAALVSARPEEKPEKQNWAKTVLDVADRGAGYGVEGLFTAADVVANAVPTVEGWVFGTDKDATFTGQVLKPITYLTGAAADWARDYNAATQARIENDTRDSRAARIVADVGSGVVGALPSVALAVLSGGTSAAAQLGTQAAGISGTAVNAANTMLHNPVVQYNFATSLGNEYNAAKASGASDMDAMTAATVSGLFNAIVESGGVEALPKQLQGTDLSTAQKAWRWLISLLAEGEEEVVQGVISEMTAKATYAANKPYFSTTDEYAVVNPGRMVREFGYGTAIGGITGAVPMASRKAVELAARARVENAMPKLYQDPAQQQQPSEDAVVPDLGKNKNVPTVETKPIRVGRATVLKSPYKGETPIYEKPQNRTVLQIDREGLKTAASQIEVARTQQPAAGKSFKKIITEAYERIFDMNGGAHSVEVSGLHMNGKPYFVDINKSVIGKVVSDTNMSAEKLAVLDVLDGIVENGEYVGSSNYIPHGSKKKNTVRFDHFETQIQIESMPYLVTFDVEVFPSRNNYRTHKVINEMDLTPIPSADTGSDLPQGSGKQDPSNSNLPRPKRFVNKKHEGDLGTYLTLGSHGMTSGTDKGVYTEYIRQLREAQEKVRAEELRQAYLRNMARLEEAEREAEMDAAFWKYWD